MTLSLLSVEDGYIIRGDEDGDEILSTPGPIFSQLTLWEDFDLQAAWMAAIEAHRQAASWWARPDRVNFVAEVRRTIADMDSAVIVWCENCDDPTDEAHAEPIRGGDAHACPSCYEDDYRSCEDCGQVARYDDMAYTLSEESVCDRCRDNHYSYCEDCDGYYHHDYDHEHNHGGCDCQPPNLSVKFRNGEDTLSEDERIDVSLPSGVISEEGMNQIARMVRYNEDGTADSEMRHKWWTLSFEVAAMDARWQTKEGNFTKRLSKLAHKSQGLKFPPELLTKVGNVARDNSNGTEVKIELTRNLNLSAADFYHEDSCWWQSYSESRCALKNNGGIGMRTFGGYNGHAITGRAWIMPLRAEEDGELRPTFDSMTADAYMIFNGYGDLSGYTPARVVAGMVGMTYTKVPFDCNPMYINNSSGYLVASEEIIAKHSGGVSLYTDQHSNLYHNEEARRLVAA